MPYDAIDYGPFADDDDDDEREESEQLLFDRDTVALKSPEDSQSTAEVELREILEEIESLVGLLMTRSGKVHVHDMSCEDIVDAVERLRIEYVVMLSYVDEGTVQKRIELIADRPLFDSDREQESEELMSEHPDFADVEPLPPEIEDMAIEGDEDDGAYWNGLFLDPDIQEIHGPPTFWEYHMASDTYGPDVFVDLDQLNPTIDRELELSYRISSDHAKAQFHFLLEYPNLFPILQFAEKRDIDGLIQFMKKYDTEVPQDRFHAYICVEVICLLDAKEQDLPDEEEQLMYEVIAEDWAAALVRMAVAHSNRGI